MATQLAPAPVVKGKMVFVNIRLKRPNHSSLDRRGHPSKLRATVLYGMLSFFCAEKERAGMRDMLPNPPQLVCKVLQI